MSFFSGLFKASDHPIGKSLNFGPYRVTILKLIAEGGYGYVYLARDQQNERVFYALKKLLIADLAQQEIDIMVRSLAAGAISSVQRSIRHKNIVSLLETSSISIPNSSEKEVYMLMEFCSGGTAAELTAQRALTEPEVLRIFSDICEAVGQLHFKEPPVSHRDLKLENLLLHAESGSYKLCDFGSCRVGPLRVASKPEMLQAEEEIQKFTTPAYRAPEMVDLYSGHAINEKVDMWALGCVLYKLCFRVTPFDDGESPLQILNVQYTVPAGHAFSAGVIQLIAKCLRADPALRPDIWSVFKKVCKLRQVTNTMERPRSRPKAPKPLAAPAPVADLRSSPGIPASMMQPAHLAVAKQTNYKHRRNKSNAEDAMAQPFPFPLAHPQPTHPQAIPSSAGGGILSLSPTPSPAPVLLPDPIPDLTASSTIAVTAQALLPLITQTWNEGGAARVFDSLSKRPLGTDAIVCLKSLICLHLVFLEGHPVVIQDGIKNIGIFNNLHTYWRSQKDSNPYAAAAICQYCKTLVKKLQFHQVHPEFEGNYSLDRYFQMADSRGVILPVGDGHPMSKDTLAQLLDIFSNVVSIFALLGDLNMLATSPMNSWVLSSALPLVQEVYDIFLNASFLTWKLMFVEPAPVFTQLQSNYTGMYTNIQALWATLNKVPTMPQIVTVPALPVAVPVFSRMQVAPLQPPRSARSRASVPIPVSAPLAVPSFNPFAGTSPNDFGKPSPPADAMAQLAISATAESAHRRTGSSSPIVMNLPVGRGAAAAAAPPPASPSRQRTAAPQTSSPQPPQRALSSSTGFNLAKSTDMSQPPQQPAAQLAPPPEPKMSVIGHRRSQSSVDPKLRR